MPMTTTTRMHASTVARLRGPVSQSVVVVPRVPRPALPRAGRRRVGVAAGARVAVGVLRCARPRPRLAPRRRRAATVGARDRVARVATVPDALRGARPRSHGAAVRRPRDREQPTPNCERGAGIQSRRRATPPKRSEPQPASFQSQNAVASLAAILSFTTFACGHASSARQFFHDEGSWSRKTS